LVLSPLHAIVDADAASRAGWTPADLIRAFIDGGATIIQLRAKQLSSGSFLDLCDAAVALAKPAGAQVVINDRGDLALLSGAHGVHVGQDDVAPLEARRQLGPAAIVGYSTHTVDQIGQVPAQALSYIAIGPVFATRTKDTGYDAVGLDLVRTASARSMGLPVVAIGGITLERAPAVMAAGASAVAVIGDLLATSDPRQRVQAYLRALAQFRV
jgi:thiamine-phosphate pyrophosphorylase